MKPKRQVQVLHYENHFEGLLINWKCFLLHGFRQFPVEHKLKDVVNVSSPAWKGI